MNQHTQNFIELNNKIIKAKDNDDLMHLLENDKLALKLYIQSIDARYKKFPSFKEKIKWMIENNYYEDFFSYYEIEAVLNLYTTACSYNFQFSSFLAAYRFYDGGYALKTNDGKQILEYFHERALITSLYLAQGKIEEAKNLLKQIILQNYQPATPTFMNAGRKRRGELYSCYLLSIDDSLNSINYNLGVSAQLSKIGGGVALDLSRLRGHGAPIKGFENQSSGVLPVAKLLEDTFGYANQLGQRPGAGAAYLNVFHWDIELFLDTKKINVDEKIRLKTLSIGVIVPLKFFELAKENQIMYVFDPYSIFKVTGKFIDTLDFDKDYDDLVKNPEIRKKKLNLSAREVLAKIAMIQKESGYPYLFYITNANKANPLKQLGRIKITNLCTEIMQVQETSLINDWDKQHEFNLDVVCVLGSLNIVNVMQNKDIEGSVRAGIKALSMVIQISRIHNAPGVQKAINEMKAVGLGAMNLHGFFAKNKIYYDSEEAKDFCNIFFMLMNYYSLSESCNLAKIHNETFAGFEQSEYMHDKYYDNYLSKIKLTPQTDVVKKLFKGFFIPTKEDWLKLRDQIKHTGLYNAYRLSIAPTQSISYINNSTSSVMPIVDKVEIRKYDSMELCYPMPFLSKETSKYYVSAYDMDQKKVLDLIKVIQTHVDQGISTVLHVKQDTSINNLIKLYVYGQKIGLKSLYYTRTKINNVLSEIEECEHCAI
ncbi:class 1b ribonucleoside-diphosphate reductase subunit alpha [Mycoplasma sp. SG1]|uniref:class 1b ribonucleoside-diphosphate reductase subunit alpha n=1 Tax=Mycoplasma sp. SG1 TaxID=2810348 RepID=UPI002023D2FE|nr:class 1b ribonucleoside-diphosphate reductase subunit alpha [Mycoplasma sp. SG1]URM52940.1 class 1b ribonucleoside-diphosphate reductase subunit alpha [Mycoplasma sp. SG1]